MTSAALPGAPASSPPVSLLLVDEEPERLQALEDVLAPLGQRLVRAGSEEEAAELAQREDFAAVLMSVGRRPGDSAGALTRLRERAGGQHPPILLLADSVADERDVLQAYAAGAVDCLPRSVSPELLRAKVLGLAHLWRRGEARRQLPPGCLEAEEDREKFFALLMEAPAAVALYRGPQHVVELMNPLCREIFGHRLQVGRPIAETAPEAVGTSAYALLDAAYTRGEPLAGREHRVRLSRGPDGAPRDCYFNFINQPMRDADGRISGVVSFAVEVTDQVLARQRVEALAEGLRRGEERFRTLAQHSAHVIWVADPAGTRFDAPSWEAFTGQPMGEMHDNGWMRMVHPEDAPGLLAAWRKAVASGEPLSAEFRVRSRLGDWRWVVSRGVQLLDRDGSVREWVGSLTDITERRLREEEALQRAEFEEQLIGIVSHDLRSPLAAIGLSAASLRATARLTDSEQRALGRIVSSNGRANRMIETLLDFTRARLGGGLPVVRRPGELHEAARHAVEEALAAHPGSQVLLTCEGDGHGEWDLERIEQLLGNLIGNALRYGDRTRPVRVECRGEGDNVLLRVHNEGNPIPAELLPTLFKPYLVGSREEAAVKGGLGLGLYIVREIVRAHGGGVEVRSSAEEGTTFTVHLPRQEPRTDP